MNERRPKKRPWLPLLAGAAMLLAVGAVAAVALGGDDGDESSQMRPFEPQPGAMSEPFPTDARSAHHYPVAFIKRSRLLYDRPGGKPTVRVAGETEWNTPRVLAVVKRRGRWVAVLAPELKNGQVGWMRMREVTTFDTVSWSLHADLSKRELVVRREGKTVRRIRVGVGRAGHDTPKGRFAVTDRLKVKDPGLDSDSFRPDGSKGGA